MMSQRTQNLRTLLEAMDVTHKVAHPLFIALLTVSTVILYYYIAGYEPRPLIIIELYSAVFMLAFPLITHAILKRSKHLKTVWSAEDMHDQRLMILADLLFYTIFLSFCNRTHLPFSIKIIPLAAILLMFESLIAIRINKKSVPISTTAIIEALTLTYAMSQTNLVLTHIIFVLLVLLWGPCAFFYNEMKGIKVRTIVIWTLIGLLNGWICSLFL